jgi:hypothetical protein
MTTTILPSGRVRVRLSDYPPINSNKTQQPPFTGTFLTTPEAAEFLRLSTVTLARWRISGDGPPFLKFSRRCVYRRRDLLRWARKQLRTSTSQATNARVR